MIGNAVRSQAGAEDRHLRNWLRLALGLLVAAACLHFAMRGTDWSRVRDVLAGAHPAWLAACLASAAATLLVRALRWVRLLEPVGAVTLEAALSATAVGFAAGVVLPLRLGELARPLLLDRRTGIGFAPALSSILVERLLDVAFVALCFFALSLAHPLPPAVQVGAQALGIGAAAGLAALVVAQRHRAIANRWVRAVCRRLPDRVAGPLARAAGGLLDGCRALGDGRTLLRVLGLSLLLWLVTAGVYLCAIYALAIPAPPIPAALASLVIVAAFVFLPQAPGLVGTWQAGCVVALGLFGVPRELAAGYSLLTWAAAMLAQVGLGGFFLARDGLSWRDLIATRAMPRGDRSGSSPRTPTPDATPGAP